MTDGEFFKLAVKDEWVICLKYESCHITKFLVSLLLVENDLLVSIIKKKFSKAEKSQICILNISQMYAEYKCNTISHAPITMQYFSLPNKGDKKKKKISLVFNS